MKFAIVTSSYALLAACALAFSSTAAQAEYYVPPGNSAVNQYTQDLPSAGGDKSGKNKGVTPAESFGAANAKRLHRQGPDGTAAAELAAATDPTPVETSSGGDDEGAGDPSSPVQRRRSGDDSSHRRHRGDARNSKSNAATANSDSGPSSGGGGGGAPTDPGDASKKGSSAAGEILGRATGSTGGTLGPFLPLVLLGGVVWSAAFIWRRRHGLGQPAD